MALPATHLDDGSEHPLRLLPPLEEPEVDEIGEHDTPARPAGSPTAVSC